MQVFFFALPRQLRQDKMKAQLHAPPNCAKGSNLHLFAAPCREQSFPQKWCNFQQFQEQPPLDHKTFCYQWTFLKMLSKRLVIFIFCNSSSSLTKYPENAFELLSKQSINIFLKNSFYTRSHIKHYHMSRSKEEMCHFILTFFQTAWIDLFPSFSIRQKRDRPIPLTRKSTFTNRSNLDTLHCNG